MFLKKIITFAALVIRWQKKVRQEYLPWFGRFLSV